MKLSKIVVATDFSEFSNAAVDFATRIARDSGASVVVAHVVKPAPQSADLSFGGHTAETESEQEEGRRLAEVAAGIEGIPSSQRLLHGAPAEQLISCARDENADMIVIGSHGKQGLMRMLLGSVAEGVLRGAHCPVVTVKQPSD